MLTELSTIVRLLAVLIVTGFMPLAMMSFFWFKIGRKQNEYDKVARTFGIDSNKKVKDYFRPIDYVLPLSFITLICLIGATLAVFTDVIFPDLMNADKLTSDDSFLLSGAEFGSKNAVLQRQALSMAVFAFLGSFIWSAKEVIHRLINKDLKPSIFYSGGIRMIIAILVAIVFYFILGSNNLDTPIKSAFPWLALFTGMVPDRVINYLIDRFKIYTNGRGINNRELDLDRIEGIDLTHKERLAEEGIMNAQNLATTSLTQLIIRTPYEARQILDWIGQAKLLCYAPRDIDKFRAVGIRSVYDFYKGNKSNEALRELADAAEIATPIMQVVSEQIQDDYGIRTLAMFQNRLDGAPSGSYDIPHRMPKVQTQEG